MRRILCALAVGVLVAGAVRAQTAGSAAALKGLELPPQAGPWTVMVQSYTGPQSYRLAQDLAAEIRTRHRVPAYVYNRGAAEREQRRQELERQKQLNPDVPVRARGTRILEQCAVVVGEFKDLEGASKFLTQVKKWPAPAEHLMDTMLLATPVDQGNGKQGAEVKTAAVNPFPNAFVVRNPAAPKDQQANKNDPFLKELNDGRPYSLLKNRSRYTLAIAIFQGASYFQSKETSSTFLENFFAKGEDRLDSTAKNAENLAKSLRSMRPGLDEEVYVLHTRQGSLVTVGGFDGENDPRLARVQAAVSRLQAPAVLLPQPFPFQIPRP